MDEQQSVVHAQACKANGNKLLKAEELAAALEQYKLALIFFDSNAPQGVTNADRNTRIPDTSTEEHNLLHLALNLNAALACVKLQHWEEAEEYATQAIRINPNCAKAFYRRGVARRNITGLVQDAKHDFQRVLSLEPTGEAAQLTHAALNDIDRQNKSVKGSGLSRPVSHGRGKSDSRAVEEPVSQEEAAAKSWCQQLSDVSRGSNLDLSNGGSLRISIVGPCHFYGKSATDFGYDLGANPTDTFTTEISVKWAGGIGHQSPLSCRDVQEKPNRTCSGYMFYIEPEGVWAFWIGVGNCWKKLLGPQATMDTWVHLQGVVDIGSREARFYVDGALVASDKIVGFKPNRRCPLRLGAGRTEGEAKFFFRGVVRDIAVWSFDAMLQPKETRTASMLSDLSSLYELQLQVPCVDAKVMEGFCRAPLVESQAELQCLCASLTEAGSDKVAMTEAFSPGLQPSILREGFHLATLHFMQRSWLGKASDNFVHGLCLRMILPFSVTLGSDGESIKLDFAAETTSEHTILSAVILQRSSSYRILYEIPGTCSMADALRRQSLLRPGEQGWISQKDLCIWLKAIDVVAFNREADQIERNTNTVFLFGYWKEKGLISPSIELVHFAAALPRISPHIAASRIEISEDSVLNSFLMSSSEF